MPRTLATKNKRINPDDFAVNEYALPEDLRGSHMLKCRDCLSRKVVYLITAPAVGFEQGALCWHCLIRRILASRRYTGGYIVIPTPMEVDMFDAVKHEIAIKTGAIVSSETKI